ncbi:MAG TPA: hypothetical protein VLX91_13295 [Candidatus Acidoferrales bacterium]|nr:hypothetical protein [Candidatus Acidoferrales bacterium]
MTERQYEITSGFIGSLGLTWNPISGAELDAVLIKTAQHHKISVEELNQFLVAHAGRGVETGEKSPNHYYDHSIGQIRVIAVAPQAIHQPRFTCPKCGEHRDTTRRGHCDDCEA